MTRMERVKPSDLRASSKSVRSFVEGRTMTKTLLRILGVLGVSIVMSGTLLESALPPSILAQVDCRRRLNSGLIRTRRDTRV
jgi:hypothetical protein